MMTYEEVRGNKDINTYIVKADQYLKSLGFTEHSFSHVTRVAETADYILRELDYSPRERELAKIAGYMHDIGNIVNRVDHAQSGAVMSFRILDRLGVDPEDIADIIAAIGNHDEGTGAPVSAIAAALILLISIQIKPKNNNMSPKLLVNNEDKRFAPFMDATGAHAGALLGDVRHDPYQSGGLGTPAHERVESGMIHKANKGVLYIDEIGTMTMKTQQELLSAMQEKKYAITGQSENSSGAMVRSQAVPCDFVLVASGNLQVLEGMHIAMRSRIRGYGYEVFMKDSMEDTQENRKKLVRFVAQEVKNDGRIPHFAPDALDEIILEAKRRSGKQDALTLKLRDLGGLVRSSGDVAIEKGADLVTAEHVIEAKKFSRTLEQQIADRSIKQRKEYSMVHPEGGRVGLVNGLAVIGDRSGIVSPIAAEAAPAAVEAPATEAPKAEEPKAESAE